MEVRGSFTSQNRLETFATLAAWDLVTGKICRSVDLATRRGQPVAKVSDEIARLALAGACVCDRSR